MKRTLSQVKVEHGYVGKTVNTEFDEKQNNANLDIGVLVKAEKSNSTSNSGQKNHFDESVEKKENYEVFFCYFYCILFFIFYPHVVCFLFYSLLFVLRIYFRIFELFNLDLNFTFLNI